MDTGHSPFLSSLLGSQVWGTVTQCPEVETENYILEMSKLQKPTLLHEPWLSWNPTVQLELH